MAVGTFGTAFASFSTDFHQKHLSRRPLESSVKVGHTSPCASGEVVKDVHNSYFRQYDQWNVCFLLTAALSWCHAMIKRTRSSHAFMMNRTDGLLFAEIRPFRREVRFREAGNTAMLDHWMVLRHDAERTLFFQSHKEFKNHSTSILASAILIHFWLWGCDAWSSGGSSSGSRWCCMAHLCRWFSKILSAGPILQAPTFTFIVAAICVSGEQVEVVSQTTEMDEFAIRG